MPASITPTGYKALVEGAARVERERLIALLDQHIASITDAIDEDFDAFPEPRDEIGDYVGDTRDCRCGERVEGFYAYHSHLIDVLKGASK